MAEPKRAAARRSDAASWRLRAVRAFFTGAASARAGRALAAAGLVVSLAACGEDRDQERGAAHSATPLRLADRGAVTPSAEIEGYARRVAARIEGAVGAKLGGGLRFQGVTSNAVGVLYEIVILEERAEDYAPPAPEARRRVLTKARANLAQSSCPFASRIERMLLEAGGEIRHRYRFEDGRPSYELALRLSDCAPVWRRTEAAFDAAPVDAAPVDAATTRQAPPPVAE